jgi:hypothetical protein
MLKANIPNPKATINPTEASDFQPLPRGFPAPSAALAGVGVT